MLHLLISVCVNLDATVVALVKFTILMAGREDKLLLLIQLLRDLFMPQTPLRQFTFYRDYPRADGF